MCPQQEKSQKETLGPSPPPLPTFGQILQEQRLVKPSKYPSLRETRAMKDPNPWFPTFPCLADPQADAPMGAEPSSFLRGCKTSKPPAHAFNPASAGFLWWRTETEEPKTSSGAKLWMARDLKPPLLGEQQAPAARTSAWSKYLSCQTTKKREGGSLSGSC